MEDGEENQKPPASESGEKPGEAKLCIIKIKVPKGIQIETNTTERMNDQPRVSCSVCDKGFASGKALAGHMRVHFQSNNVNNHQNAAETANPTATAAKKNTKTDHQILLDCWAKRENNSATAAASGPTTCSICGKNFPSMKSLFGHMRCHPDREWRGINPPPSSSSSVAAEAEKEKEKEKEMEKNSFSSTDDRSDSGSDSMEISAVDLAESLPKWSATDRRGRKPRASSVVVLPQAEERNLRTAVEELIRLAHGDSLESGLTNHHHYNHNHRVIVESFEATNSNSSTNNEAEIEDKNLVLESRKRSIEDYSSAKKKLKFAGESSEKVKTPTESENLTDCKNVREDELEELMIKKKKMRKKLKLSDLESAQDCYDVSPPPPPPPPPVIDESQIQNARCRYRYVCSTCNKCFPSHQALGGHRSSHNKVRIINNTTTIDHESSSDQNELQTQFHGNPKTTQLEEPITTNHRCTICNKTFPTGQALGGHKRCHWTGPAVAPSTSAGESSQTGDKVLGFDLNEPPPAEDDEEGGAVSEHAAGYGHASSSHNSAAN